ncbi:hypothetical protein IK110_04560 [Candidatus Saccharibacteria bacterium]|nr:hypothetical protein [Candidatus Saccharibacteria bacterium]
MKFLLAIVMFICSLFGFGPKEKTAKSWAYQDPDTGITYSQENPEGDDALGPAIRINPDTGYYETSDGLSWPAN